MSLQASPTVRVVVTDTNILINLTHIGRFDLLGKLPPYSFVVPEEVVKEVKEPAQSQVVQQNYLPDFYKLSNSQIPRN